MSFTPSGGGGPAVPPTADEGTSAPAMADERTSAPPAADEHPSVAATADEHPGVAATADDSPDDRWRARVSFGFGRGGNAIDIGDFLDHPESQSADLKQRVGEAIPKMPFTVSDLQARLQAVADNPDRSFHRSPPSRVTESPDTPLPPHVVSKYMISCRDELIRCGGRASCSVEELSKMLLAPMASYEAVLPWLEYSPDSEEGFRQMQRIFMTQFDAWWSFRKSQWVHRGLADSEKAELAYVESMRRDYRSVQGERRITSRTDEAWRIEWRKMPPLRAPEGETFSTYHNAVKKRLAPYQFTRSLQLRKDPQQQSTWTDWLEYLSFEIEAQEDFTRAAESREMKFDESLTNLLKRFNPGPFELPAARSALGLFYHRSHCWVTRQMYELNPSPRALGYRDKTRIAINDFALETEPYTKYRRAAFHQRHRVAWVVKETHLIEAEMSLQSKLAKDKKRTQRDKETSESQPKRTKREDASRSANSVAPSGKTHLRRSVRLATRKH